MRWRDRSSWWGFHPYLLQPISCRSGLSFGSRRRFFAVQNAASRGRGPRLPRGDTKSQAATSDRGYNSLSTIPLALRSERDWHDRSIHLRKAKSQPSSSLTLICNLLIASPFAPKKFLKQFTAFLGEHPAVDVAAMI